MTLGGRRKDSSERVSEQFHQLWKLTLGLPDDFSPEKELPRRSHLTSGTCFYFDVAPKCAFPDVKAYIPLSHYASSDAAVAKGLVQFLEKQGRAHYAEAYVRTVESLATAAGPDAATGVQTYISCAYQQGQVSMTSYLSPQLYHPTTWS
jgi:DMATS type aromatic prenyltransferase